MTGAQFLNLMVKLTDKNTNDSTYRAFMLDMLNLVIKDIQNRQERFHYRFLETSATASTVADQFFYGLPTDIDTHKIVHISERTNDITYKFIPYETFRKYVSDQSKDSKTGRMWTLWASQIGIYPVPSEVITIYLDYIKLITALADDANSCEIPAKYDNVIVNGALHWAYKFDPQLGDSSTQFQLYMDGVNSLIRENAQIISEEMQPESHRGKNKIRVGMGLFPLDNTNM